MSVWSQLVGQNRLRPKLERAASDPSGSYLFVGPPGVGKAVAARLFAAAQLCPDACGSCTTCSRVLRGIHPDVQSFEPEGYTYRVEIIREVVASAALSPLEAERRVFILEEADRITERSQNALLKALEEPNPRVTWVLLADSLDPFLPTILSRCSIVEFAPIPADEVEDLIGSRFDLEPSESALITRNARGDIDRAIALASNPHARTLRLDACEAALSSMTPGRAMAIASRLTESVAAQKVVEEESQSAELEMFDETAGTGRGVASVRKRIQDRHKRSLRRTETDVYLDFIFWIGLAFRDIATVTAGAPIETLVLSDLEERLQSAAPSRSTAEWLRLADACQRARLAIIENANAPLTTEALLLSMTAKRVAIDV